MVVAEEGWAVKPIDIKAKTIKNCAYLHKKDREEQKMCEENVQLRDQLIISNEKLENLRCRLYGPIGNKDCTDDGIFPEISRWFDLDKQTDRWKIAEEIGQEQKGDVAKRIYKK